MDWISCKTDLKVGHIWIQGRSKTERWALHLCATRSMAAPLPYVIVWQKEVTLGSGVCWVSGRHCVCWSTTSAVFTGFFEDIRESWHDV